MREIKFRVWGMTEKMMIYFSSDWAIDSEYSNLSFYLADNESGFFEAYSDEEESKAILMQYIGLKDKNSKEICEGDILTGRQNPIIVEWKGPEFSFKYKNPEKGHWVKHYYCGWGDIYEPEIIGNIYENPELLEKK